MSNTPNTTKFLFVSFWQYKMAVAIALRRLIGFGQRTMVVHSFNQRKVMKKANNEIKDSSVLLDSLPLWWTAISVGQINSLVSFKIILILKVKNF